MLRVPALKNKHLILPHVSVSKPNFSVKLAGQNNVRNIITLVSKALLPSTEIIRVKTWKQARSLCKIQQVDLHEDKQSYSSGRFLSYEYRRRGF